MKILDRYILTTYLKTFISVFLILMLIFVLQTIWLYIKELAGKDLDIIVVAKFLIYFMPKLIPLVLPLTILLASIMVFGSFAENYEFAAMKSTGISLQRAMSGLSIFIIILGFVTFLFSNNVIPWAELNSFNLRRNIAKLKPAMLLAEGQFNEVGTYNIKFADKHGDNDQYLEDITIHIKGENGRKNTTTIKSKTGELASEKDSNVLKLILLDGNYYKDITRKKTSKPKDKKPFAKSTFKKYTINIDLSKLNNVDFDEKSQTDKYNMLDIIGLNKTIDSLSIKRQSNQHLFTKSLFQRSGLFNKIKTNEIKKGVNDSIYTGSLLNIFNPTKKSELIDVANKSVTSAKQIIISKEKSRKNSKIKLNKHIISLHEKFALGFACVILFFVGAPLGALIRKGGIGLPMIIAILLFLTYHFIGIFATNSAKSGNLNPILASWFSTLTMLPLGFFLTKKATADKPLFQGEGIFELLKKLFRLKKKTPEIDTSVFSNPDVEYITLNSYEDNKLINIAKNHKEFGYKVIYRNTALKILNSRGITNQQLKFSGNFINREYEQAINLKDKYEEDAKLTFVLYIISFLTSIPGAILDNNNFPKTGTTLFLIGSLIELLLIFSFIKFCVSQYNYYKHTGKSLTSSNFLVYLLGIPLFFIVYFFQKKEFEKDLDLGISDAKK